MDQEDKSMLREIKNTVSENNQMLKKLVLYGKVNLWIRVLYWAIIVLIAIGAVAIIKPFIKSFTDVYSPGGMSETFNIFDASSAIDELKAQLAE